MKAIPIVLTKLAELLPAAGSVQHKVTYPFVGTGRKHCHDNARQISCPLREPAPHGQHDQTTVRHSSYALSLDGLTVLDNHSSLIWKHSPGTNGIRFGHGPQGDAIHTHNLVRLVQTESV